jgi:hypothetical protein
MNVRDIGYWVTSGLFAAGMAAGGLADVLVSPQIAEGMVHLGYPEYFARILGAWKLLGVIAILAPGFRLTKEWAYAGFTFALTGAAASHLAAGDGLGGAAPALVMLALGAASYALRPDGRAVHDAPTASRLAGAAA